MTRAIASELELALNVHLFLNQKSSQCVLLHLERGSIPTAGATVVPLESCCCPQYLRTDFTAAGGVWCVRCFCFFSPFKCWWGLNFLTLCVVGITGWSGIICANKLLLLVNLSVHKAWLNWRLSADLKGFYVKYVIQASSSSISVCKNGMGETANTQSETQLK